jgi:hypothetical protein
MPFYPYRDERFQHEVMRFKNEWSCETDPSAPLVYADGRVVDRKDFEAERQKILEEVPLMRRYAAYMFKYSPHIVRQLTVASAHPQAKHIVTSLSSFMTAIRYPHMKSIAEKQIPVLDRAITSCHNRPELGEFLRHYEVWRKEMSYI